MGRWHSGPAVNVVIDISSQSMSVKVNGWPYGRWKVSTARSGYYTPRGTFRVQRTAKVYYSRKYDNSPMPNSVFFKGGYAIHGSYYVRSLGRPPRMAVCGFFPPMPRSYTIWFRNMVQSRPGSHCELTACPAEGFPGRVALGRRVNSFLRFFTTIFPLFQPCQAVTNSVLI